MAQLANQRARSSLESRRATHSYRSAEDSFRPRAGRARWRERDAGRGSGSTRVADADMDVSEVEFLAEKELVTIIPNFSLDKIYLIGVSAGPGWACRFRRGCRGAGGGHGPRRPEEGPGTA